MLIRFFISLILFTEFTVTDCFSQKDKLTGHWKITRMVSDDYPAGIDLAFIEKTLFDKLKVKWDSAGIKAGAEDSVNVKKAAKEGYDEIFGGLYFQLNPNETCAWNFGSIKKGTLIKGKYKIKESLMTLTLMMDKDQSFFDKDLKAKERKMIFFYYFKEGSLRLDSDDGSLRFELAKD